jgi:hypothetical protein
MSGGGMRSEHGPVCRPVDTDTLHTAVIDSRGGNAGPRATGGTTAAGGAPFDHQLLRPEHQRLLIVLTTMTTA